VTEVQLQLLIMIHLGLYPELFICIPAHIFVSLFFLSSQNRSCYVLFLDFCFLYSLL